MFSMWVKKNKSCYFFFIKKLTNNYYFLPKKIKNNEQRLIVFCLTAPNLKTQIYALDLLSFRDDFLHDSLDFNSVFSFFLREISKAHNLNVIVSVQYFTLISTSYNWQVSNYAAKLSTALSICSTWFHYYIFPLSLFHFFIRQRWKRNCHLKWQSARGRRKS